MTDEQLRAAIMDIVTDAWDRSRQIDGAVDEIMDAVALAAQHPSQSAGEPVGTLSVSRFRGHLENHSFDYTGSLPDGTYQVYTSPPPADAARASGDGATQAEVVTALEGLCEFNEMAGMPTTRAREVLAKIAAGGILSPAEPDAARVEADRRDALRLDWLDATNARSSMGWDVGVAPAGNVSMKSVIQLGRTPTSIRDAIDAALDAERKEQA